MKCCLQLLPLLLYKVILKNLLSAKNEVELAIGTSSVERAVGNEVGAPEFSALRKKLVRLLQVVKLNSCALFYWVKY